MNFTFRPEADLTRPSRPPRVRSRTLPRPLLAIWLLGCTTEPLELPLARMPQPPLKTTTLPAPAPPNFRFRAADSDTPSPAFSENELP